MAKRQGSSSVSQERAWGYYGYPGSPVAAVGEVGYVVDWRSFQMTRLDWDVFIDGSPEWDVEIPSGTEIRSGDAVITEGVIRTKREDGEEDQTAASAELLDLVNWDDTNIRALDTNLFVAGKGDYANLETGWRVVSTVEPKRKETLAKAADTVPFIDPHPANPQVPNPPLSKILDVLEALEWLTRQSSAQSKQRVLMNGVMLTADGFQGPNGVDFWEVWNETLSARQADPDDMSPVRLTGPLELIQDGVRWVLPPFGYDDVLDRKIAAAIQRLGWGLPVPPEVLMGMQAQSRATAFQVEENAYRAHIEPPAKLVAQVAEDALKTILPGVKVRVAPNPSAMLARKQSVEDVKWARENGLVTPAYTREVMGIPEDAAPDPEVDGVPIGGTSGDRDPANVAADEPVTAAVSSPTLSDLLADIDKALSYELAGATVMATDRARQRLGAAARSNQQLRSDPKLKGLKSAELATQLGLDGLTAAGVDVADQIAEPIDAAARWWVRRIGEAWSQTATLVPGWSGQGAWVEESVELLADRLASHIVDTLTVVDAPPLEAGSIRDILNASSGG